MESKKKPYPYFKRIAAFIVDWYVSTFLAAIPIYVFQSIQAKDLVLENRIDNLPPSQATAAAILGLAIFTLYFSVYPLGTKNRTGQTLGRRLLKLDLVKIDGSALTFKDLFIRDFVGVLLLQGNLTTVNIYIMTFVQDMTAIDIIPYYQSIYTVIMTISLILLLTKRKQTVHDLISRTKVTDMN